MRRGKVSPVLLPAFQNCMTETYLENLSWLQLEASKLGNVASFGEKFGMDQGFIQINHQVSLKVSHYLELFYFIFLAKRLEFAGLLLVFCNPVVKILESSIFRQTLQSIVIRRRKINSFGNWRSRLILWGAH